MRCDLHVHTVHSGMCTIPVVRRFCRESYNDPLAVYEELKRQGMDLVTVTDHDSIGAAESLRSRPDFFLSEEVTCVMPSGTEIHTGVYGLNERQHVGIQRRRGDVEALSAYLREQDLLFSLNHVFSGLTGRRESADFELFERCFPAIEIRNGAMLEHANRRAAALARQWGKVPLGGSDAHSMASAGATWTEVPGARSKAEFLEGLRRGRGAVHGESGRFLKLTADVLQIGFGMMKESRWTLALAPLALAVPAVTLLNYVFEALFLLKWARVAEAGDPASAPLLSGANPEVAA